jgi:LytS/YehU family sensor histidine kinase
MTGIFGGLLGGMRWLGGWILYALIGPAARRPGGNAEHLRTAVSTVAFGILTGFLYARLAPPEPPGSRESPLAIGILCGLIGWTVLAVILTILDDVLRRQAD